MEPLDYENRKYKPNPRGNLRERSRAWFYEPEEAKGYAIWAVILLAVLVGVLCW